jgi:hypothetical protein
VVQADHVGEAFLDQVDGAVGQRRLEFDKMRDDCLTGRDATAKVEVLRVPLRADLAFMDDF